MDSKNLRFSSLCCGVIDVLRFICRRSLVGLATTVSYRTVSQFLSNAIKITRVLRSTTLSIILERQRNQMGKSDLNLVAALPSYGTANLILLEENRCGGGALGKACASHSKRGLLVDMLVLLSSSLPSSQSAWQSYHRSPKLVLSGTRSTIPQVFHTKLQEESSVQFFVGRALKIPGQTRIELLVRIYGSTGVQSTFVQHSRNSRHQPPILQ